MLSDADAGEKQMLTAGIANQKTGLEARQWKDMLAQKGIDARAAIEAERARSREQSAAIRALAAARGAEGKEDKADLKDWYSFADKHNANIASSRNVLGMTAMKQAQAARLLTLADSQKALDPQEVTEFAMGMAGLLQAGGASGAVAQRLVHEIKPNTFKGDVASFLQYISANPQDAGAQEFVKRMVRTIKREQDVMEEQALNAMLQGAASRRDLLRKPKIEKLARDYFNRAGMKPEQIDMVYGDAPMPRASLPGRDTGGTPTVNSKAEFDALPKGAPYINGRTGKPEIKG
jgi:hypothetical protein